MSTALVSVIVATYRRKEALKRALDSIQQQTLTDIEIVVVDDNDSPEWNDYVLMLTKKYEKLRLVQNHPNKGSAQARNVGILAAGGEYITFLDDDDEYLPEKVELQVRYMQENALDYCLTNLDLYYDNGDLCEHRKRTYISKYDRDSLLGYHLMYHMTGTDTMMFRKDYLVRIGMFDPIDVGDEYYLMQKAIQGGGGFGYLDRTDVKAYVHTGDVGLSSGMGKITGENALYTYKKQYFKQIDAKSIRYIKMRHYAVLAFAYLRMHKYIPFCSNALMSFLNSPMDCIALLLETKKN